MMNYRSQEVLVSALGLILALAILLVGVGFLAVAVDGLDTEPQYQYDVKAEQVNDASVVENASDIEYASEEEQELLYDAFKEEDGFLSSSSASIIVDEPLDDIDTDTWKVVEAAGVPILMAIDGPNERVLLKMAAVVFAFFIGIVISWVGFIWTVGQYSKLRRHYARL